MITIISLAVQIRSKISGIKVKQSMTSDKLFQTFQFTACAPNMDTISHSKFMFYTANVSA